MPFKRQSGGLTVVGQVLGAKFADPADFCPRVNLFLTTLVKTSALKDGGA